MIHHRLYVLDEIKTARQVDFPSGAKHPLKTLSVQVAIISKLFNTVSMHNIRAIRLGSPSFDEEYNEVAECDDRKKIVRINPFLLCPVILEFVRLGFNKLHAMTRSMRRRPTSGIVGDGLSISQQRSLIFSDIKALEREAIDLFSKQQRRASSFGVPSTKDQLQLKEVRSNSSALVQNLGAAMMQRQAAESVLKPGEFSASGENNRELLSPALKSFLTVYEGQSQSWSTVLQDMCKVSPSPQIQNLPSLLRSSDMVFPVDFDNGFSVTFKVISPGGVLIRAIGKQLNLISTEAQKELTIGKMIKLRLPNAVDLDGFLNSFRLRRRLQMWLNWICEAVLLAKK